MIKEHMRFINRARLLWSYLLRRELVPALPVEYIVETTAKCNLYCPMCPRETHPQPKEDMSDAIFHALVQGAARTAEHMMLIGLGEPFLDPKIFDRIGYCEQHGISTLLSTNGVLLDEAAAEKLLQTPLAHITLSFDGATKESFEQYRKGAKFERVRANFVRFATLKHQKNAKMQIVVQMVRMPNNAHEVEDFKRFWSAVPGVDQVRIKEDETPVLDPQAARTGAESRACHYLWRGPYYVKQDGRVFPCCQSYALDGQHIGRLPEQTLDQINNSPEVRRLRRLHATGRAGEIDMCARCCVAIPHPVLVAGSLILHGKWVRRAVPVIERLVYGSRLPQRLLAAQRETLVQIDRE
jgi:radical SAM protein with 4Fe4S-binding SPASM domain